MNLLSKADRTQLASYCQTYSVFRDAQQKVAKVGPYIVSPDKKFPMHAPWYTTMRQCQKDMMGFADRFGLHPQARARLAVDAASAAKPADPKWAKLIG